MAGDERRLGLERENSSLSEEDEHGAAAVGAALSWKAVSEARAADTLAVALRRPGLCWESVGSSEVRAGGWSSVPPRGNPCWRGSSVRRCLPVKCILSWVYLRGWNYEAAS